MVAFVQLIVLVILGAVAMFECRSHGEVSIFTKYAILVWLVYVVLHVASIFLKPTSGGGWLSPFRVT